MAKADKTKKQIIKAITKIKAVAEATGMRGQVSLHFSGIHPDEWEAVLQSITEFTLYRHYVEVCKGFQVALLLD